LIEAFGTGIDMSDEEARGLVASTARLALAAEDLGDELDRGEGDSSAYASLVGARDRGFARLKELRAQPQASRVESAAAPGGWSQPLYRHLHWMGWLTLRLGGKPTHEDAGEGSLARQEVRGSASARG
jgi:hypothetical protein